jgi:predicted phosphodiesterase
MIPYNAMSDTGVTHALDEARVLIVGDLHLSDKYSGRHIDYFRDCMEFLAQVTDEVRRNNYTHVFFTGDIIGRTTEKNIGSRDALMVIFKAFQVLNQLTNNNVYTNRGNHDYSTKTTDFEMLVALGYLKTDDFVDLPSARIHLIDYGEAKREISVDPDKFNLAIMHDNIQVAGATNWFMGGHDGVELATLENLYGVDFVVGGHIHTPSVRMVETTIRDKTIKLFYPGNGTRPKYEANIWTSCYGITLDSNKEATSLGQIEFPLRPSHEIFQATFEDYSENDVVIGEDGPTFNIEDLRTIMEDLKNYNIMGEADYKTHIQNMGGIDKEAVDLALEYVEMVEGEFRK